MSKLLVPINGIIKNSQIISCLNKITKPEVTEIELFYCSRIEYPIGTDIAMYATAVAINQEQNVEELNHLKILKTELEVVGYKVKISSGEGFFVQEFLKRVKETAPDYILMFTGGSHNLVEEIFGTNTYSIIKEINTPIFVVPLDYEYNKLDTAIVGLSLEDEDYTVFKHYFHFAEKMDIRSRFVKINNNFQLNIFDDENVLNTLHELYPDKINFIAHKTAEFPSEGLEAYAKEENADLIVLFTTHRNFIDKLFHKSVTRDLTLHGKWPLLIYHY